MSAEERLTPPLTAEEESWLTERAGEPWAWAYSDDEAARLIRERRASTTPEDEPSS